MSSRIEHQPPPRPASAVSRGRMTSAELAVWRSLVDTTSELRRVLGSELHEVNLSPGDYQVLLALVEAPDRHLRSAELAAAIDWEGAGSPTTSVEWRGEDSWHGAIALKTGAGPTSC